MKIILTLTVLLGLILAIRGTEKKLCDAKCYREYLPLCAVLESSSGETLECTFATDCLLNLRRCETNEEWRVTVPRGACDTWNEGCRKIFQKLY